nr:maleylpyruvate isomerase family mycothiol-dependent enzyme [Propionibacterium sp.]
MLPLDPINAETERFAAALQLTTGVEPVPTCPDWTTDDLLWHLTEVHAFWAAILTRGVLSDDEVEAVTKPVRPTDRRTTFALLADETAALVASLAARGTDEPAWSWFPPDRTVGFTRRMQVHEATMHRVDAELAAGLPSAPIAHEVAADGIDHAVRIMWGWWGTNPGFTFHPTAGVVELLATDGGRWLVQGGRWRGVGRESGRPYDEAGAVLVTGAEPVASVTGSAEDLYRWLWGRGAEPVTSGNAEALAALRAAQAQGMQ